MVESSRAARTGRDPVIFLSGNLYVFVFLRYLDIVQTSTKEQRSKSKIMTPKDPKAFRRNPSLRCAMKAGSPELGNLWATKSRQGKYEERKERGGNGGFIQTVGFTASHSEISGTCFVICFT
jgi:hypothetical protein